MSNYPSEERCWCGVALGTPGHPHPHYREAKHEKADECSEPTYSPPPEKQCDCPCHVTGINVHIHLSAEPCCPDAGRRRGGTPTGTGKGDPTGKLPDPPAGVPRDPWDIIQVILKTCRGDTPPPRKDSYLPYLVVRANPADHGQRPLPNGTVFWESPDIFVMPNQPVVGAPGVPTNLGGMAQAGAPNTIFAHVWNLGRGPAFDVRVEFYWFNPTLGIEGSDANLIGFTYVTLGNRNSTKSHAVVRCPVDWIPTFLNNGHECLVVRAYAPISDPLDAVGSFPWSASQNRHVAQRNIAVLRGIQTQATPLVLKVAPGHSTHDAEIVTVSVSPNDVPWMQLLTGKRNPAVKPPTIMPLVGMMPPAAALGAGSPRLNVSGLSQEALAQVLSSQYRFNRAEDPLEVTLVAKAQQIAADEAHIVRVQQSHDGQLVGGYTTILLP